MKKIPSIYIITAITTIAIIPPIMFISSCSEQVSMSTAEEQRTIARDNSNIVAKRFVADNPELSGFGTVPNGDSTISRDCPQGDGWASLKLVNRETGKVIKIKCSTYSMGIGCMTAADFNSKANYMQQEGNCNEDLDYPIPKIIK